jgi:uncharacterized ferritin-like protein (DUF455 family)
MTTDLFACGRACLEAVQPAEKVALTLAAARSLHAGACSLDVESAAVEVAEPGRPARPLLVHHSGLPNRKLATREGRAAFIHALAHIEFNAINLAWDAVLRFRGLPNKYYHDWVTVAQEEAVHFSLLEARLNDLGYHYGDFEAHDGLWEMATRTADDVLVRLALVPRVLEARGLDVTPAMIVRLQKTGDTKTAAILEKIYADEIGHVEAGSRWFRHVCRERGLDPAMTFRQMLVEYNMDKVRSPVNEVARKQAGFDDKEIAMLMEMTGG